jgi:IS30 family transposase
MCSLGDQCSGRRRERVVSKRRWRRLPRDVREQIIRLAAKGLSRSQICEQVKVGSTCVRRVLAPFGGVYRGELLVVSANRLSLADRVEIRLGLERGESQAAIARRLDVHPSTVCRELQANGGPLRYQPVRAHMRACRRAKRPKPTKLSSCPALLAEVVTGLEKLWSPAQISQRCRVTVVDEVTGDDRVVSISHETIYKSLYVQGRGELRRELAACLRTGRAARRAHGSRSERRGKIPGMVMISERPAEIADRAVAGHWEGDLIIGKDGKSAIGTLVERSTRFVMLLHLPNGRSAAEVREAMVGQIMTLPAALRRSITWDQGKEMSEHAQFTIETGIDVYFCDPHSPWQRGSNENTNGLLRQYFPKGVDLSRFDRAALDAAAASLNSRPRQTLGWMTPSEKLNELLVASTG